MNMRQNPRLNQGEATDAFINRANADDTSRLHCIIPAELHHTLKFKALERDTNVTEIVIEALRDWVARQY